MLNDTSALQQQWESNSYDTIYSLCSDKANYRGKRDCIQSEREDVIDTNLHATMHTFSCILGLSESILD